MSLLHGYGRNFTTHWLKLSQQSAPSGHFLWPTECGWRARFPLLHSMLVSAGPAYAKHWLMWGLFAEMCYSHQTGLVKSQHVVLLLKHPRESKHQADRACISSSVSSFSSPLPGTPPPNSTPTFSFFLAPHKSYCKWVTAAFNPLPPFFYLPKTISVWVSGREKLSVIYAACVPSQPACLHPELTTHESKHQRTMWDQMFFFS